MVIPPDKIGIPDEPVPEKVDLLAVDPPGKPKWVTPKYSKVRVNTEYKGKGNEDNIWLHIRANVVAPVK